MKLEAEQVGQELVVRVGADRIDAASAIQFKDAMRGLVRAAAGDVVLDLEAVRMIDSSGLGAVVSVRKMLGEDRRLVLTGLSAMVEHVFRLTRVDTILDIRPSAERVHDSLPEIC